MKLLVTGSEGQVAQSLAEAGRACGVDVVTVGRPVLDVTEPVSVSSAIALHCPDIVVNAAAYTAVDRAESEPDKAHLVNTRGAGYVAEAAQAAGLPIIHISTDFVFDGRKGAPYLESDTARPVNAYGCTKLAGEMAVADANRRHLIVRTQWVHSPYGRNFVKTMLALAATRDEIGVVDDQCGSPTYAPDLADAILEMARQIHGQHGEGIAWGIYHASGSGEATWWALAQEALTVSGATGGVSARAKPIPTEAYPLPAQRPADSRLCNDKLHATFGVRLPDWRAGVAACIGRLAEKAE